ncbi:hypothetical protein [Paenibacillus sambharensis]|uniref:hypothetical protein n=1 Tax=Paenibacillus sambharensis TaxID=1803190 RepID=UPI0015E89257|nr:hypothetical protein [Paenibacillus sambharensis]
MQQEAFMVMGDLYNRIFAVQTSTPEQLVDYAYWNQIFANLPKGYMVPDLPVLSQKRA